MAKIIITLPDPLPCSLVKHHVLECRRELLEVPENPVIRHERMATEHSEIQVEDLTEKAI